MVLIRVVTRKDESASMSKPLRSDYRLIQRLIKIQGKKKDLSPTSGDFDKIIRVFAQVGGSWEKVFKGSVDDMTLLKKIIKVGIKKELFTKKETWS